MNEKTNEHNKKIIGHAINEYTVQICMRSLQINNLPFCAVFIRSHSLFFSVSLPISYSVRILLYLAMLLLL